MHKVRSLFSDELSTDQDAVQPLRMGAQELDMSMAVAWLPERIGVGLRLIGAWRPAQALGIGQATPLACNAGE